MIVNGVTIPAVHASAEAYAEHLQESVAFLTDLIDRCVEAGEHEDAESLALDVERCCDLLDALQAYA